MKPKKLTPLKAFGLLLLIVLIDSWFILKIAKPLNHFFVNLCLLLAAHLCVWILVVLIQKKRISKSQRQTPENKTPGSNRGAVGLFVAFLGGCLGYEPAIAQIHQEGQTAVEVSAGTLDAFKLPGRDNFGFFTGLSYSKYRTRYSYWKGAVHLNQKYYAYDKAMVPVSQWLGEASLFTRVMGLVGNSWVLNVGGGVAGGYESINQDRRTVEGATLMNRSNWIVGPTLAIEWEYILSGRTILVARAQEYYLFRSSITPTRFNLGLGLKIILPSDTDYE